MRDFYLRWGISEGASRGVSFTPRFSRHSKCLSNKAVCSGVQNFVISIGKPNTVSYFRTGVKDALAMFVGVVARIDRKQRWLLRFPAVIEKECNMCDYFSDSPGKPDGGPTPCVNQERRG
jgi:hypothetical protein